MKNWSVSELWTGLAATIGGAIGAIPVVALWNTISQRMIGRRQSTFDYIIKRKTDAQLREAHNRFYELAKEPGGLGASATADEQSADDLQKIREVLDEYELVSNAIQFGDS